VDTVGKTQKLSSNSTEANEETLEETLLVLGDVAAEIEAGAKIVMQHPSDFYRSAAKEVTALKDRINELELMLEGAKRGVERYVYGPIEIVSEQGEIITTLDEWVSRQLIDGAIQTYILKAIVKGTE
jgi:hypothetical protein